MGAPERDESPLPPLRGGARVAAALWVAAVVALYWAVQLGAPAPGAVLRGVLG